MDREDIHIIKNKLQTLQIALELLTMKSDGENSDIFEIIKESIDTIVKVIETSKISDS